jgi:hypothetical protein
MMIFNLARGNYGLKLGAPPDTIFAFNSESGYINKELLLTWLNKFHRKCKTYKIKESWAFT